jgi:hypothetical protein
MKTLIASLIGAFFVALSLLSPTPSQAYVVQPWCTDPRSYNSAGAPVCAYQSYAQCQKNAGFVYPIQPSLFIRVIGFIASSSQKNRPHSTFR